MKYTDILDGKRETKKATRLPILTMIVIYILCVILVKDITSNDHFTGGKPSNRQTQNPTDKSFEQIQRGIID